MTNEQVVHQPEASLNTHFDESISGVINIAVTTRNINFFAHRALEGLIGVIEEVKSEYSRHPTVARDNLRDTETSAFNYFGLTGIEEILSHVERRVEQLENIDRLIQDADVLEDVIIPPFRPNTSTGVVLEREEDEEPEFQKRLKTILFVIANEFDIDIYDRTQLRLSTGIVPDTITRERSYYSIEIPSISRIVFICDQKGNVTYVFDHQKVAQEGADLETLAGFNKPELNELIIQHPGIGVRVPFSNNYVPGMLGALKNNLAHKSQEIAARNYLNPEDREHLISLRDMSRELVINERRLKQIIPDIEDFGEVALSRHGHLYTYAQQEKLRTALQERGEYAPRPEDDEMSLISIARALGIERKKAEIVVEAVRSEIGEPKIRKFGGYVLEAFNGDDLEIIERKIPELYPPDIENFPGYLTIHGIVSATKISTRTIQSLVKQVEGEEGLEPVKVSKMGRRLQVYSPAFQSKIKELIQPFTEDDGIDLITLHAFANNLGINGSVVKNVCENNFDEIGKLARKSGAERRGHQYLDKEQQDIITRILTDTGRLAATVPEGYLSFTNVAKELKVAPHTLKQFVETCSEELGELKTYKFMSKATTGYSPSQQEILRRAIQDSKKSD